MRRLTIETKCVQPHFNSQDDIACIIEKLFIVSLLLINPVLMNNCLFGHRDSSDFHTLLKGNSQVIKPIY